MSEHGLMSAEEQDGAKEHYDPGDGFADDGYDDQAQPCAPVEDQPADSGPPAWLHGVWALGCAFPMRLLGKVEETDQSHLMPSVQRQRSRGRSGRPSRPRQKLRMTLTRRWIQTSRGARRCGPSAKSSPGGARACAASPALAPCTIAELRPMGCAAPLLM